METVFVWWQGNRPALFRLVSAIMKKHHQLRMEAQCSVYCDTQQIITIDCYPGTRKKRQWKIEQRKMDRKSQDGDQTSNFNCIFYQLYLRSQMKLLLQRNHTLK